MISKRWEIRSPDPTTTQAIADQLHLPFPIACALVSRGYQDVAATKDFLNPRLANLSDPFSLPDMEKAVARIWKAINGSETITVFGDYDVDGVTATALLMRILTALGANVNAFIPDRLDEGYGLSPDALERCLAEHDCSLLVSVDCGTNSVASVEHARSRSVDVIVTDHHVPEEKTAPAFALINPKRGMNPDLENISGAGVAFKVAHALVRIGRDNGHPAAKHIDLRHYLDIVALGTVADIVPLADENRIIVRYGLDQMNATLWPGMEALKDVAGVNGEIDTFHLGFQLGPRVNAAGRIGEPMQALRLLVTNDPLEARNIARLLDRNNRERRDIERKMADEAFEEIDSYFDPSRHFGLVVAREGWHPGVVGIVASRVSHHYNRPTIVMGIEQDGSARGSCRSIDEFDMLAGLHACQEHLAKFGGHKMAAGLEVKRGAIDNLKAAFNAVASSALENVDLSRIQYVDAFVEAAELDWDFFEQLKRLRPFGQDNREPVWALRDVRVVGSPRVVGQKHLKLTLVCHDRMFEAIAFNYPLESLPYGKIDVAFTLKENSWGGNNSLQLQVQEIRSAS